MNLASFIKEPGETHREYLEILSEDLMEELYRRIDPYKERPTKEEAQLNKIPYAYLQDEANTHYEAIQYSFCGNSTEVIREAALHFIKAFCNQDFVNNAVWIRLPIRITFERGAFLLRCRLALIPKDKVQECINFHRE